uniref:ASCH domain-containing protein n=1 Tax=viral metagenome TaxID=1070528 RepID=A0A6M3JXS7_9ZZZZ
MVEKCPYGVPGDRLWVRETWAHCQPILDIKKPDGRLITEISDGYAEYKADGFDSIQDLKEHVRLVAGHEIIVNGDKWKPSIFMPRWASRITLEVTGIRVERVQDISEKDAREEGVSQKTLRLKSITSGTWADIPCYKAGFKDLWDSINGKKYPWVSNPWVWVISFRKIT